MNDENLIEVDKMTIIGSSLDCPNCGSDQSGWLVDPRGRKWKCEDCGKLYFIPENVKLLF